MKKLFSFMVSALVVALSFTSCNKDEEVVDVRDAAVANYNGTMTFGFLVDGEFEIVEDFFGEPETINAKVEKDGTNDKAIRIDCEGDVFYGNKIEVASNGFAFDMESQKYEGMTVRGCQSVEVGTTKYDGAFFSDENKLSFVVQISLSDFLDSDESVDGAILEALFESEGATAVAISVELNKR